MWEQLKGWIDPGATGLKKLDGRDPYASNLLTVDTLANIARSEIRSITKYPVTGIGYTTGFNSDSLIMYAEYFANPAGKQVSEVIINVAKVNALSSADSAKIYLFSGGAMPGTVLGSQKIYLSESKDTFLLKADFTNTISAGTSFYIGWRIWYKEIATSETRQFAVFHSPDRIVPSSCTAWFSDGSPWKKFTQHPYSPMSVALDVKVVVIGNPVYNGISVNQMLKERNSVFIQIRPEGISTFLHLHYSGMWRLQSLMRAVRWSDRQPSEGMFPGREEINIQTLANGLYYVAITSGEKREIHKLLIAR